jgi:hypothetical protein
MALKTSLLLCLSAHMIIILQEEGKLAPCPTNPLHLPLQCQAHSIQQNTSIEIPLVLLAIINNNAIPECCAEALRMEHSTYFGNGSQAKG